MNQKKEMPARNYTYIQSHAGKQLKLKHPTPFIHRTRKVHNAFPERVRFKIDLTDNLTNMPKF